MKKKIIYALYLMLAFAVPAYAWNNDLIAGTKMAGNLLTTVANNLGAFASTTSAQLRAVMSDETGSGALYFQNGNAGTPTAIVLTNATGLPLTTGVTGVLPSANGGVGTLTGLIKANGAGTTSVAVAGTDYLSPGGAAGTPSSITLTNGVNLPLSGVVNSTANTLFGFNGSGIGSDVTIGAGCTLSAGTLSCAGTGAGGTVTTASVVSANGFSGTVANATTTPAITLSTTASGILKGSAGTLTAATSGTDYSAGTSALATGIVKSTTTTGALTIAVAGDFPTLNQSTTGNAATVTTNANLTGDITSLGNATTLATVNSNTGAIGSSTAIPTITTNAKGLVTAVTTNAVIAPAATLTGTTLSSSITASSIPCTGLSNGATGCSTSTGTSGATIPLNNGNNTLSGTNTITGALAVSGAGTIAATSAPISGISGLGTGVATWAATPSGANFAAAILNPVSGATAEYPFTEGTGTTAYDISGNANTATLTGSTSWSSQGVVLGSNSYGWVATPVKTWKTYITQVCNAVPPNAGTISTVYSTYTIFTGTSTGDGLQIYGQTSNTTGGIAALYPSIDHSNSYTTTGLANTPACAVVAFVLGSSDHIYVNGVEETYGSHGTSSSNVTTTSAGYNIGSDGAQQYGVQFGGTVGYSIFYPTALTLAQVQQVTNYINQKVTTRVGYPVIPAPFISNAPQLLCFGDSLTAAYQGNGDWCNSTYAATNNTYTYDRIATAGDTAGNEVALMYLTWASGISSTGPRNVCNIWIGTNDISQIGQTVAQTWAHIQQLGSQAKSLGCVPIVTTMISRNFEDTYKNSLNALIRANWRTSFAALNDLAAIPVIGADGAYANPSATCFNADGVHLNGPAGGSPACYNSLYGYGVAGWNTARVVNILDGSTVDNPTATTSNSYTQAIGDNYVLQTPTSAATDVLPDCTGLTSIQRTIINGSSKYAITVNTSASQTITGSNAIAPQQQATFTCRLTGASTGGNYWVSSINPSVLTGSTKFTASGCSNSTTLGGATAGSFASGTTGTCTVTVTMNGATGLTAPNGWACRANDLTTTADTIIQTATTSTTATLSGTTVTGDVINFSCIGY